MLSFGNKRKNTISWHFDFRLQDRLPDTKIIRTSFLVNLISFGICFLMLAMVGYHEIRIMSLKAEIRSANNDLEVGAKTNDALLKSIDRFRQHANSVDDLNRFFEQPIDVVRLLVSLSALRNEEVAFDVVRYTNEWNRRANREEFIVSIDGKGKSTEDIILFKANLLKIPLANGYNLDVIEDGNPVKEHRSGHFSFRIRLVVFLNKK
ncbi:MAG: hypothetical protein PHF70_02845 [Opitutales bacterium]|nr:hypothetical protein [Opitutales bacterium]